MIKRLGVTGSRHGLSLAQLNYAAKLIKYWEPDSTRWFHHGDCIGVDISLAAIAAMEGYQIATHPPENPKYRANLLTADITFEPKPYMVRNLDIVKTVDFLLVVPDKPEHLSPHSGTWATKRMAQENNVPFEVIMP